MSKSDLINQTQGELMDALGELPEAMNAVQVARDRSQRFVQLMAKEDRKTITVILEQLEGMDPATIAGKLGSLSGRLGLTAECSGADCGVACATGCIVGCAVSGETLIGFGAAGGTIGGGGTSIATSDVSARMLL